MDINTLSVQVSKSSAISDVLLQLENSNTDNNFDNDANFFDVNQDLLIFDEDIERVAVRITAHDIDALTPFLDNLGFEILGSAPEHHLIEGHIAVGNISHLEALANEGLIMGVLPVYRPITNVGLIDSQADFVHEADRVREALPTSFDGTGQRVAVFSDSYDTSGTGSAATDIASGDLPAAGVTVLQELDEPGIDEGRAMLQLVHDLAPGADLVFSSVFFGEANFAQQIRDAADPAIGNASVLVDDIGYLSDPFFQDGLMAQAVDDVVINDGVTYFSAAGNSADESYESTNINFVNAGTGQFSNIKYDFNPGAGIDTNQQITLAPGAVFTISLQWDDPFFTASGVDTDLDIFIYDGANNLVAQSATVNTTNQTPFEIISIENISGSNQDFFIEIEKFTGPDSNRIKWISFDDDPLFVEYDTNSSTVYGQPAATNAQAVAAIPFFDQNNPEPFTSEGPTTILFAPNGTPLATPEIRQTPDIAAIDNTNTTFFGSDDLTSGGLFDLDTFPNFPGTSAAAPHAAAIAALVQQANPTFTPHQVYDRLQSTAEDIAPSGFDNVTGFGLINAYDAIFGAPVPATLPFIENFDDGDLPLAFETNTNDAGRIEVTNEFSPLGIEQLTLDSSGINIVSLNEAILHLDTTGYTDITLSFEQKEFEDEDDFMPATFVGSNNSDGVALSVDGTNWFRLVSLTGGNSTSSFQNNSFDLSAIAIANGLTLGSNVQIKFQQFDNFPLTGTSGGTDGFAFDDISVTGTLISTCNPTAGNDNLIPCATPEDDNIDGLGGNDTLEGAGGNDTLNGGNGTDLLSGNSNNDVLNGGNGNDTLNGGNGADLLAGNNNNDVLNGGIGNDTLNGGSGADLLSGNSNNDVLNGGLGNDTLNGGSGADFLSGNNNNDVLNGGRGNDTLNGGSGADLLSGNNNNDVLNGGLGNDTLNGGSGADLLSGNNNSDVLNGGDGNDTLNGGNNNDRLNGGSGSDTLIGALGLDTLHGGSGSDRFRLESTTNTNRDIIEDFEDGTDLLDLTGGLSFSDLTIAQVGSDTNIIETATNQTIAVLQDIDAGDINMNDFI